MKPLNRFTLHLLLLFLTGLTVPVLAQEWKEEAAKKQGPEKVSYLFSYAKKHNLDQSTLMPLEDALQAARKTNLDSLVADACFMLGRYYEENNDMKKSWGMLQQAKLFYLRVHDYTSIASLLYAQTRILARTADADSMIRFLDKNQPLIRLSANRQYNNYLKQMYGYAYMLLNKRKEAEVIYTQMIPDALADHDTDLIITLYMNIGQLQPSFDSSMTWYKQVLDITRRTDKSRYADLLRDIGIQYSMRDDTRKDSALYYFLEAEKNVQHMKEQVSVVILYNNMGEFFFQKNEFPLALSYFRKAVNRMQLMEKPVAIPLHNMALVFLALKQPDSADAYRKQYQAAVTNTGNEYELMLLYQLQAGYARATGDSCSEAQLQNYEKAIGYAVQLGNTKSGIEMLVTKVFDCLLQQKQSGKPLAKAILAHCRALYHLVKQQGKMVELSEFLERYAQLEELYGDRSRAFDLYKELASVLKEIHVTGYAKGMSEAVVKYKSELKDAEISLLNEKDKASATRTRFILAGMIALLCIAVLVFMLYRRENKNKRELDARNKKVEELLREIHHRVKNNLQIVSSFINIQIDRVKDRESVQALMDTSRRIMALANLHHSLYRQDDFSKIRLDEYIRELSNTIKNTMPLNAVEIHFNLATLELEMDQAIPLGLSLNELLTNALKYAFESGQPGLINISLQALHDEWELVIRDNGKGLPEEQDNDPQKKSIGLRLVQNLVQRQVKGTFTRYNDGGAVFVIRFKVLKTK